jgi:hypothetical protein
MLIKELVFLTFLLPFGIRKCLMKRLLINLLFYSFLITMSIHGMFPLENTGGQRLVIRSLQEIALNALVKNNVYSYLSQPTCSELSKTDDVLSYIPSDLLADITSTQSKNISLSCLNLPRDITGFVAYSDPNKVVMVLSDGSLIGVDTVSEKIYYKAISFENLYRIYVSNHESSDESADTSSFSEALFFGQSDTSSDYAFSSDEVSSHDLTHAFSSFLHHASIYDSEKYIFVALSSDGRTWGAVSTEYNDRLLIGSINDLFDIEVGGQAQVSHQVDMAEELGVHYGELKQLALRPDGLQCAAVWEPLSSRFTETQKLLFWQDNNSVKETVEMPRINALVYANNEPLLVVSHENGNVSLWDTQKAILISEIKFFEPEERIVAINLSRDDKIIYASSITGKLCAFNRVSKGVNQRCVSKDRVVQIIQSHPQDLCLATVISDGCYGNLTLWNKDITKRIASFHGCFTALNFSHDGTFLYLVTSDKQFQRIPLGNPWELVCLRALHSCTDDRAREQLKNSQIYKKVMAQDQKERGLLGSQLCNYLTMRVDQ